ncbi:MAG: ATP-binding protein, partial [Anaerolineales bacterium]
MSLPLNPYIAGAPLRGDKGFFGRQDTMEWVERELRNSQTNALVLFGQRRIGKTTLLLQLARNLSQDEFLPIYFDLQDQATRPLGQTLADIADTLCEKANLDLGQVGPFDDQGRYFQKEFLPKFYAALGEKRRPVFLLDEFDVLDQTAEA